MKTKLLILSIAALCFSAAPAMAGLLQVKMDSIQADLTITPIDNANATGTITLETGGWLNVDLEELIGGSWTDLDNTQMYKTDSDPDFLLTKLTFPVETLVMVISITQYGSTPLGKVMIDFSLMITLRKNYLNI